MAEMKAGYKQTDIGVIPEDWDVNLIKNICQIKTGDKNTQDRVDSGTYPFFVRSQNVERINSYSFDGEAVLTAGDGETGKIFHYINGKFDFHQRVYKMSHFNKRIDGFYFYKYFSNNFYTRIMSMTAKSSVDSVRMEMIANMQILLPKLEEQKQIAVALSDVDGLIESLEKLIAKKRDMKTAAMQQLLTGKKRLPGFDGEWEELTLGDVCSEINDGTHYTPTYVPEGVPFYSVENVTANDFVKVKYITQEEHNLLIKRCRPETGDILLTRIGSIGDTRLIDWDVDASIYVSLALLKTNQKAESAYVYEYTKSSFFIKDIEVRSLLNATPKKINMGDIKGVPIKCPKSRDEQFTIAKILSDMRAEIDSLEQRLDKAHNLKTGMMQELLTGKTRLIKTNKNQEAA